MYTLVDLLLSIVGLANSIIGCVIYELDHTTLWCGQGFINPGSKESERALDIENCLAQTLFLLPRARSG